MEIGYLKLLNFRNYSSIELNFSNSFNIIYGNNGMGKTNLVEAIYVLALTKSFRTIQDKNLIMKDKNVTKIEGIVKSKAKNNYKVIINEDGKKVKIDNNKIDRISEYISKINVVLFNPDDLKLVKDTPSIRRKMLNIELSQLNKSYLRYLNSYNKILKQRNAYLKQVFINGNSSTEYLDILTNKLIDYGIEIESERRRYIDLINSHISDLYYQIANKGLLEVKYISDYKNKSREDILKDYRKLYPKEMAFGKTLIGVHHDDLDFILDGNKLKEWGSEGQLKNSVISFKLAEIRIIKELKQEYPILILDDLFSELDQEKINNIMNLIDHDMQTFITTTDISKINKDILSKGKIFKVTEGSIEEE